MANETTSRPDGFEVNGWVFTLGLILSAFVLSYVDYGLRQQDTSVGYRLAASAGYAFFQVAIVGLVAAFSFSQKKKPRTGVQKMTPPTIVFVVLWGLFGLASGSEAGHAQPGSAKPAADGAVMALGAGSAVAAGLLLWALPWAAHLLRRIAARPTRDGTVA